MIGWSETLRCPDLTNLPTCRSLILTKPACLQDRISVAFGFVGHVEFLGQSVSEDHSAEVGSGLSK